MQAKRHPALLSPEMGGIKTRAQTYREKKTWFMALNVILTKKLSFVLKSRTRFNQPSISTWHETWTLRPVGMPGRFSNWGFPHEVVTKGDRIGRCLRDPSSSWDRNWKGPGVRELVERWNHIFVGKVRSNHEIWRFPSSGASKIIHFRLGFSITIHFGGPTF